MEDVERYKYLELILNIAIEIRELNQNVQDRGKIGDT